MAFIFFVPLGAVMIFGGGDDFGDGGAMILGTEQKIIVL